MKNTVILTMMITLAAGMNACKTKPRTEEKFNWVVDRFDDIKVLRYQVPGFDTLSLEEKKLIYYLNQAALCGRDIFFDQTAATTCASAARSKRSSRDTRATARARISGNSKNT